VGRHGSTLQIGEPAVIAERTGVTTVANFRARDVAAGGDGAPLVPYVDYVLFAQEGRVRAAHNLGGISNLTVVTEQKSDVFGFDTGPGNMPIDCAARILTEGRMEKDDDGKLARKGRVNDQLLALLLEHPFLKLKPPKSTGAEEFGAHYVAEIIAGNRQISVEDMLATITRFVAESILKAYKEFVLPKHDIDEIVFSGGGTRNGTLMRTLQELLSPIPITTSDTYGIPSDAKEAVAFAVLANETVRGNPGNIPAATGAAHETVLGTIVPGRNMGTLFSPPSGKGPQPQSPSPSGRGLG
jgi:anhydro-N-acetylmuramic acid kinase